MSKFTKLLELTDYADAKPILETAPNLSDAAYTLAQTAYQIKETQPQVARNFLKTVIKECDDEEKKDEKIKEVDGGTSDGSSSTTGLEKVGTEGNADESMTQATDTHDQMGVPIGEMAPPMPPNGAPPAPPQQVPPQVPVPPAPPVQMQYTIQEAQMIRGQFKAIKEALKVIHKEIKETQNSQIKTMDVGTAYKGESMVGRSIKETTGNVETDLQKTRLEITKMNDELYKGA